MSPRARRLLLALGAAALVLFAGRWTAALLADRWWAGEFSAAAADFLTQVRIVQLLLDLAGALVGSAWFIGHLLIVFRAIAAVQVSRNVANLEVREAVTPRALLGATVAAGAVLGVLAGADLSGDWRTVALAWQGARLGLPEPYLGQDAGLYVTQLPLWQLAHGFALLLVVVALTAVFTLYGVIGAVRWREGRPAVSDHARQHLGWLFAGLALVLAWGYLLEPYEWVADGAAFTARRPFALVELASPILTGFALTAALVSLLWGYRARHLVFALGWLLLVVASLTGHYILPAFRPAPAVPREEAALDRLQAYAADLDGVRDSTLAPVREVPAAPPAVPTLWFEEGLRRLIARDTAPVTQLSPAPVAAGGRGVPSWLVVRAVPGGVAEVFGLRDDRVGPGGAALPSAPALHAEDEPLLELPRGSIHPAARGSALGAAAPGPVVGAWPRRVLLAWALQEPALLRGLPDTMRVAWLLQPLPRLTHVAPFAEWGAPALRIVSGRPVWVSDGYLTSERFPAVPRAAWRQGETALVRAAFTGLIDARTGATRIIARPEGGVLAAAWAQLAPGLVEPPDALPEGVRRVLAYPSELLAVQAAAVARRDPSAGRLLQPTDGGAGRTPQFDLAWRDDGETLAELVAYERADTREISALLEGRMRDGRPLLTLWRAAPSSSLPSPGVLAYRWERFTTFGQLRDSVKAVQGTFIGGPVRFAFADSHLVGLQTWVASGPGRPATIAWVAVAVGDRWLGAGRTLAEAWENLRGTLAPVPAGSAGGTVLEARRWLRLADSALARGDFAAFGRAFEALRQTLGAGHEVPR